jgi:hypothetical protein
VTDVFVGAIPLSLPMDTSHPPLPCHRPFSSLRQFTRSPAISPRPAHDTGGPCQRIIRANAASGCDGEFNHRPASRGVLQGPLAPESGALSFRALRGEKTKNFHVPVDARVPQL